MPSDDAKPPSAAEEKAKAAKKHRTTMLLNFHFSATLCNSMLTWNARAEILKKLCKGNPAQMATILAYWGFSSGLGEFLLNPTLGKLSDAYGRKPFMLLSPAFGAILKALVAVNPSLFFLTIEKVISDGLRTISGSTMVGAAFSDALDGSDLGQAYGNLESYAGFAVMSMPMLASYIMNKTGSERAPFAAAAALSALQVLVSGMVLTETLPAEKRKPFTGVVNPLDCMRLFTITPTLSLTCGMLVLQWLTEPKNVADVGTLLGINQMKLSNTRLAALVSVFGFGMFLSGPMTSASLAKFGESLHTSITNLVSAFVFTVRGAFVNESAMWSVMPFNFYAGTGLATTRALATNTAIATGKLGNGEFSGMQANLRAFVTALAPMLYSGLYRSGTAAGQPGRPFLVAAAVMLGAELIHRKLRKNLLQSKKEGV